MTAERVSDRIQGRQQGSAKTYRQFCSILRRKDELQQRQEAWRNPVAKGPLGSRRCVKSSRRKGLRLNPTEMAGRRGWPRISQILNLSGQRASADVWTPPPRSISPIQQRTSKDYDTRTSSPWPATIIIKLVRCRIVRITSLLRELLQVYKLEKGVKNPSYQNMKDLDADPSTSS